VLTIIDHSACLKVYMRVIIRPRDSRVYTETTECNMLEASTVLGWRQLRKRDPLDGAASYCRFTRKCSDQRGILKKR